jgi:hypothetical protein
MRNSCSLGRSVGHHFDWIASLHPRRHHGVIRVQGSVTDGWTEIDAFAVVR